VDLPEFLRTLMRNVNLLSERHISLPSVYSYLELVAAGQTMKKEDLQSAIGEGFPVNPYFFENFAGIVDFVLALTRAKVPRALIRTLVDDGIMSIEDLAFSEREDPDFSAKYLNPYSPVIRKRLRGAITPFPADQEAETPTTTADVAILRNHIAQLADIQRTLREHERLLHENAALRESTFDGIAVIKAEQRATKWALDAQEATLKEQEKALREQGEMLANRIDSLEEACK